MARKWGGVRLDDVGNMGAPEEGLLGRNLLATASGIGRNFTVGFGKGETQRERRAEEPGLGTQILEDWGGSNPTHTMNRNTKEDHARTNRAGQHWMVERIPLDWQLKNRAEPHAGDAETHCTARGSVKHDGR